MAIKQAPEKPGKFHKDTFDKTTEARRQTVLSAALQQEWLLGRWSRGFLGIG